LGLNVYGIYISGRIDQLSIISLPSSKEVEGNKADEAHDERSPDSPANASESHLLHCPGHFILLLVCNRESIQLRARHNDLSENLGSTLAPITVDLVVLSCINVMIQNSVLNSPQWR